MVLETLKDFGGSKEPENKGFKSHRFKLHWILTRIDIRRGIDELRVRCCIGVSYLLIMYGGEIRSVKYIY